MIEVDNINKELAGACLVCSGIRGDAFPYLAVWCEVCVCMVGFL